MARMMDDAQSAKQPQVADQDAEVVVRIVAGLRNHIFGKGEEGIVNRLRESGDEIGRVVGEIVFTLLKEAAAQAVKAGNEITVDLMIVAATELIDDLTELMAAHGRQLTDKQREYALLVAQQLYLESTEVSEDDRLAAQQQLGNYKQGGQLDKAVSYVQQRGMEAGSDPFGVSQMPSKPGMMGRG